MTGVQTCALPICSARLAQDAGYQAIYVTGAGLANSRLGVPDIGLVGFDTLLDHVTALSDVVDVPLVVDADTGFGNAVSEDEARALYEEFSVAAPGKPLFEAAAANFNPWTDAKVNSKSPDRGPLLVIAGEKDHTVPWAIANASFKKQQRNPGVTEIVRIDRKSVV